MDLLFIAVVIMFVCISCVIVAAVLITCQIYREETCPRPVPQRAGERPYRKRISSFNI